MKTDQLRAEHHVSRARRSCRRLHNSRRRVGCACGIEYNTVTFVHRDELVNQQVIDAYRTRLARSMTNRCGWRRADTRIIPRD